MSKLAVEHIFNGTTVKYTSYDSTKTNLGKLITQLTGDDNIAFAGPIPIGVARPVEQPVPNIYGKCICAIPGSKTNEDWVFVGDGTTAAATRNVAMFVFDRLTSTFTCNGFITITFPNAGNKTTTCLKASRHTYSTGTVGVSGNSVTGDSTAWQTARFAIGSRIGFGSSDPNLITTWYNVTNITSDTSITICCNIGTVTSGTSYVIEELRVFTTVTSSIADNGGLIIVKGLNPSGFSAIPNIIPAAISTDNIRAAYWLKDASTGTINAMIGIAYMNPVSNTSHPIYVLNADTATTLRIYKFDLRASLTVAGGATTSAFMNIKTNAYSSVNNLATTCNAAYVSSSTSVWFVTTTAICQATEDSIVNGGNLSVSRQIQNGDTDLMATYVAPIFTSIEYLDEIDRVIATANAGRCFVYTGTTGPVANTFTATFSGLDTQFDQSTAAPFKATLRPKNDLQIASQGGMCYALQPTVLQATNTFYAVPFGADWGTAAGSSAIEQERLITPSLTTTGATKLLRVYVNSAEYIGDEDLAVPCEAFRIYARTSGIVDDSGGWTAINQTGDLSDLTVTSEIQIMLEFRMFGLTNVPSRIYNLVVVYEDGSTDSHFVPSADLSNSDNYYFVWNFLIRFNQSVPTLRVRLYDAVLGGAAIVDDDTATPTGTFEKSTNGGSDWVAWNVTDLTNQTTYLRYTPSVGDQSSLENKIIRALLTLN